jgi:acetoin utilization deacetylase AcuC-like enzyme
VIRDRGRAAPSPGRIPRAGEEILRDFETLIRDGKILGAARDPGFVDGAEFNPKLLRKKGKGSRFLVRNVPSIGRLLRSWKTVFRDAVSPRAFLDELALRALGFEHRDVRLLFTRSQILYDAQIFLGGEGIGEMTLSFASLPDPSLGPLGVFGKQRFRVVYIEHIRLAAQRSGYASALFRHYEELLRDLGFDEFRLQASLSIGRYYWAKEGFEFSDRTEVEKRKVALRALVKERNLPVREVEIGRLNHPFDIAGFRKDLKISVFRDADGYHALTADERFSEEVRLPLGKAFLLASAPWEGHKAITAATPRRTGLVASPEYLLHRTRHGHPESPARLEALHAAIEYEGLRKSLVALPPYVPDLGFLETIHGADYLASFREAVRSGAKFFSTGDCSVSPATWDVALLAAGGVMAAVDAVMNGRVGNAFCAIRPPGHHTGRAFTMGFCFINNVAVGAVYARTVYGVERIFILDWDVHHGNGTQEIFEEDPLIYYCSIHEHPTFCFPGTGRRMERGKGAGAGFTLNLPLRPLAGDGELVETFEREVVPAIDGFHPGLILVSAGFDGHENDPIADLRLTSRSFVHMTRRICELADRHCSGRVVSVLEGGYEGPWFASSVTSHLRTLQGRSPECSSASG